MKVASARYEIKLCVTDIEGNELSLVETSETGTWETHSLLLKMGASLPKSHSVVYHRAVKNQDIKISTYKSKFSSLPQGNDYAKGFLFWALKSGKPNSDMYFEDSPIKSECLIKGSEMFTDLFFRVSLKY